MGFSFPLNHICIYAIIKLCIICDVYLVLAWHELWLVYRNVQSCYCDSANVVVYDMCKRAGGNDKLSVLERV